MSTWLENLFGIEIVIVVDTEKKGIGPKKRFF
jgi:hypothetical protein